MLPNRVIFLLWSVRRIHNFTTRSHTCGELRIGHVGCKASLAGWIHLIRMNKFVLLRDTYGTTQLIIQPDRQDLWDKLSKTPLESVLEVVGNVCERPEGQANMSMATGEVEVEVEAVTSVNESSSELPFRAKDHGRIKESLRMQYRYLDLRRRDLQHNLRVRSGVTMGAREFLCRHGFVDVETPTLFRRTPGGAKEFVVPTRAPGKFYSLVQSPQQFKQLLMVAGLDRYFQVARCYRDEGAKPDRQPEFTQLDIELSFTTRRDVQKLVEQMLVQCWPKHLPTIDETAFQRMTYNECISNYGVDKPDLRFDNRIQDVTGVFKGQHFLGSALLRDGGVAVVKAMAFTAEARGDRTELSAREFKDLENLGQGFARHTQFLIVSHFSWSEQSNTVRSSILKKCSPSVTEALIEALRLKKGDYGFLVCADDALALPVLGSLRNATAKLALGLDSTDFKFLWVEDFPLFLPADADSDTSGGASCLESAHHPFTQPHPDDICRLDSDPMSVRSLHYDLVLNGQEIGGGSIRIHDARLQVKILRDILGEDSSQLAHLLSALSSGCPPHGGIALGVDRLAAILCGVDTIRDVIAFPKANDGRDIMADAPTNIEQEQKRRYHIDVIEKENLIPLA